jgi:hypothetical protein
VLLLQGGEQQFGVLPCVAILASATAWSLGSVLNRSLQLPASLPLTSGAAMLLGGGMLLARMPATRIASHAYVHPVVAVALGYLVAAKWSPREHCSVRSWFPPACFSFCARRRLRFDTRQPAYWRCAGLWVMAGIPDNSAICRRSM